jgi:hypothetical protein
MRAVLGVLLALAACGGDDSGGGAPPIPPTPLHGTVAGKPFTAKSAVARKSASAPEKKAVSIYDVDATCERGSPGMVDHYVLVVPVWKVGVPQDGLFSAAFNDLSTTPGLIGVAEETHIEVVSAPTEVGQTGILRVRARYKTDFVEGQIDVKVCE